MNWRELKSVVHFVLPGMETTLLPSVESMAFKRLPLAATLLFTVLLMGILFIVVVGMTLLDYFFIVVVFMQRRP